MRPCSARTWIEISASALRANLMLAEHVAAPIRIIPTIKANAYGHGQTLVAEILKDTSVPFLAVDSFEEACEVQKAAPEKRVLILGYVPFDLLKDAVARGFSLVCSKEETLQGLANVATPEHPAKIHLEIETGLYRQGVDIEALDSLLTLLKRVGSHVILEGVCTHFSNVEDLEKENEYPALQEDRFARAIEIIETAGFSPEWRHIACSAAIWLRPMDGMSAARLGISLYGVWSSEMVREAVQKNHPKLKLEPVITWKTIIAELKMVKEGEPISYGRTERVSRHTKLAVLPIGYADGFDRRLSSVGEVLVRGVRCRVLGRVCMNMCMIDVTNVSNVCLEDEVTIFGKSGQEEASPEDWERFVPGMVAYEAVARLRQSIPRFLVE
ncbi:alanine racemase [Patescibacteria group bacterium]|nr:alanine racemase [Patescibacteria group bacterium]